MSEGRFHKGGEDGLNVKTIVKLAAFATVFVLAASAVKGAEYLFIAASAVLIHELGHVVAAKLLHVPLVKGKSSLFGLSLQFDFSAVSYYREAAVSMAGAAANVAAFATVLIIVKEHGTYSVFFLFSNLSLALFNLLPISPLDGSGILKALISSVTAPERAEKICAWTSAVLSLAFFVFCVYVQLRIGANLSLMFMSIFLLYYAAKSLGYVRSRSE